MAVPQDQGILAPIEQKKDGSKSHPFSLMRFVAGLAPALRRIARTAVHGSAVPGLKRYLCLFAARGACGWEHLPLCPLPLIPHAVAACIATLFPLGCPARRAALRIIGETSAGEQLLLAGAKREAGIAIGALNRLFC